MGRRPIITLCLAAAALAALMLAPAAAPAKSRGAKAKRPSITRVTPMRVSVGALLTIRGRNFSRRRTRNTVIFRAPNGRSVFVKPTRASTRKLVVRVPSAVARITGGKPTRFKLRVLAGKFSSFTKRRLSPVLLSSKKTLPGAKRAPGATAPAP